MNKTRCNFCMLEDFKKVAERADGVVVTRPKPTGVEVLIKYHGDAAPTWCAWFTSLPNRCVCGQTPTPHFTCPACGIVSYHPKDVEHSFCARCGVFWA